MKKITTPKTISTKLFEVKILVTFIACGLGRMLQSKTSHRDTRYTQAAFSIVSVTHSRTEL